MFCEGLCELLLRKLFTMKLYHFIVAGALLASCSSGGNHADYASNLALAQAAIAAHENEDIEAWVAHFSDSLKHESPVYGAGIIDLVQQKEQIGMYHAAFDDIKFTDAIWLPGVNDETGRPDGSVRCYGKWTSTFVPSGKTAILNAYHYFSFTDGKISQSGDFFDFGGLMDAVAPDVTTFLATHDVKDASAWMAAWVPGATDYETFKAMGVSARLFQSANPANANGTAVLFDVTDVPAFEAFTSGPEGAASAENAGVKMNTLEFYSEQTP
jgi:hypothetical protein